MTPIIFSLIPTIVGSAMLIGLNNSGNKGVLLFGKHTSRLGVRPFSILRVAAVYLIGTFGSALASVYAYNASNTAGHTKKVTINAMTLATFSVGNIIGTEIFQPKDAPAYIPGKTAIMVLLTIQLFISYALRLINIRLNKKRKQALAETKESRGWSDDDIRREREKHAFMDLTDKQYVLLLTSILLGPNIYTLLLGICSSSTLHDLCNVYITKEEWNDQIYHFLLTVFNANGEESTEYQFQSDL